MAPGISSMNGKELFAVVIFISAVFILGLKLMNPTPLVIWYTGEDYIIQSEQIGDIYTTTDVFVLIAASLAICASGLYLLLFEQIVLLTFLFLLVPYKLQPLLLVLL